MDAIMFSANPSMVRVDDAIRHLADHNELYWEVGFRIDPSNFSYPLMGFIHIKGGQVEYKTTIRDIKGFSPEHYESQGLAARVKPEPWLREWEQNYGDIRSYPWKSALVITEIEPFSYDTYEFSKYDGSPIKKPPQSYVRVLPPGKSGGLTIQESSGTVRGKSSQMKRRPRLAEQNLEAIVVHQLEEIEPGLKLMKRQLSTAAGRLDLLCKDNQERYVVVELKRGQGTDQVVGQILRYMGWVQESYKTDQVRGIIIVGKKDQALSYAVKAVPNIQVREFKLSIE